MVTPPSGPEPPPRNPRAEELARQLGRERLLMMALLIALVGVGVAAAGARRVWAVAVYDPAQRQFVTQVYVPEEAQARAALNLVSQRAVKLHAYYRTPEGASLFAQVGRGFAERVIIAPVSKSLTLAAPSGAASPVETAATVLGRQLQPAVDAVAIVDTGTSTTLAVLPTEAMAKQALAQRQAQVVNQVRQNLGDGDKLISAGFVQTVEIRPAAAQPLTAVLDVPAAVAALSEQRHGSNTHQVSRGETIDGVAAMYEARRDELATWNPGVNLSNLKAGTTLIVRRSSAPLTVLTVEQRAGGQEIRRHDGLPVGREPVAPPNAP